MKTAPSQSFEIGSSSRTKRALAGKFHVTVGDQDTFYLNGPVEKLGAALQRVGIPATIDILPGKNHNNLYGTREDPLTLLRAFAGEMYATARPAGTTTSNGRFRKH